MMIQMILFLGDEDRDESLELLRRPGEVEMRVGMEVVVVGDLDAGEVD